MKKIKLNNTDLNVSPVCLGCGGIGVGDSVEYGYRKLDAFIDAGGNFLDTARIYSDWVPGEIGRSERLLGDWIKDRKHNADVIIATKGAHPMLDTMNISRLDPKQVESDLHLSLKALQTDTIDLYYLHRDDTSRSVEEIIDYLEYFKSKGWLRHYACSNWTAERIIKAQNYAASKGYMGFSANSMLWNMGSSCADSLSDNTLVKMDKKTFDFQLDNQITAIPYSSQAGGFFNKLINGVQIDDANFYNTNTNIDRGEHIKSLIGKNISVTQYVIGYLMHQPLQTIPIIGSRTIEQLQDSIHAANNPIDPGFEDFI